MIELKETLGSPESKREVGMSSPNIVFNNNQSNIQTTTQSQSISNNINFI